VANHPRHNLGDDEEVLPLLFAKQVKFLRGPGSALHGVGTFSGVINVLSADRDTDGTTVQADVGLGARPAGDQRRGRSGPVQAADGRDRPPQPGHRAAAHNLRFTTNVSDARARTQEDLPQPEMPAVKANLLADYTFSGAGDLTAALTEPAVSGYAPTRPDRLTGLLPGGSRGDEPTLQIDVSASPSGT
jgi:outer membrane receptor protein involved in Fe transport